MIIPYTKTFNLRCLPNGRAASSAFTVRIPSKFDVEDLRNSIKTSSRTTDFNNVELVDIRLWKVLIPDAPSPFKDVKERKIPEVPNENDFITVRKEKHTIKIIMDRKQDSIIDDMEDDEMPRDAVRLMAVKDIMQIKTADDDKPSNVDIMVNQKRNANEVWRKKDIEIDWRNEDLNNEKNIVEEEEIRFLIDDFDKSEKQLLRNSTELIDMYPEAPREGFIHIVVEIVKRKHDCDVVGDLETLQESVRRDHGLVLFNTTLATMACDNCNKLIPTKRSHVCEGNEAPSWNHSTDVFTWLERIGANCAIVSD